ncbi:MAG: metal ABC transporter permease, partial [Methanomicrobia archaeon]|nr:metal ABC transporter permease [Methanomicrobia archaeon]
DEEFARVNKIKTKWFNYLLAALTSITIIIGIRAVGTLLISSLIIFPTIIALQITRGFKATILTSVILSIAFIILGFIVSFAFDWPTGSTIVVINGIAFLAIYLTKNIRNLTLRRTA